MIIRGMPNAEYHKRPEMSQSRLKRIAKTPAYFKAHEDGLIKQSETASMTLGTQVHCATLEATRFWESYYLQPTFENSAQSKAGKLEREDVAAANPGKEPLTAAENAQIWGMAASVRSHPAAEYLLSGDDTEVSVFGMLEDVPCRCRPDALLEVEGGYIIVDLKTTTDASKDGFGKSIANFGYDVQAAWYSDVCTAAGMNIHAFAFVAVESSIPYLTATYMLTGEDRMSGREQYKDLLQTYKQCVETGIWPGYSDAVEIIELPGWYKHKRSR